MTILTGAGVPEMRRSSDGIYERERPVFAPSAPTADWRGSYTATSVSMDIAAAILAGIFAITVRFGDTAPSAYVLGSLVLAPLWILLVTMSRAYEHRYIGVGTEEVRRVVHAGVALMAVVSFFSYAAKAELSRGYVVIAIPSVVLLSVLGRCIQRNWLHRRRASGACVQRTVVVGSSDAVRGTVQRLHADVTHGMSIVGACLPHGQAGDLADLDLTAFSDLNDLEYAVTATRAEVVTVLSSSMIAGDELRRLAWRLEAVGAELVVCSGLTEISGARVTIRPTAHSPMLQVARARLSGPSRVIKGAFDRSSAALGLILISPLLVAVAVVIWCHDKTSPFFRQTRVGLNGDEFRIWKFRTMVADAEALKAELTALNESDGVLFKIAEDPRITTVGKWLRRFSVDELPQLFNVVRGEMSLVGPRPPLPEEVAAYGHDMRRRLLVKPGMTGLWQVSGRSQLSWAEAEQLDVRYVENWSLSSDMVILWQTIRAVSHGGGAY